MLTVLLFPEDISMGRGSVIIKSSLLCIEVIVIALSE
jgi:hypothetical protein